MRKDEMGSDLSSSGSFSSPLLSCCASSDLDSECTLEFRAFKIFPLLWDCTLWDYLSKSSWCFQTMLSSLPQDCLLTSNKYVWSISTKFSWQPIAQMSLLLIFFPYNTPFFSQEMFVFRHSQLEINKWAFFWRLKREEGRRGKEENCLSAKIS